MIEKIIHGNNIEVLKTFSDNYFDSVVTDPPYGISFMGKKWDYDIPNVDTWKEVLRVLKPGGHMLVACGTKTQHRMAVNIEDAGFEIRDIVAWVYGSGFPKSMNVSKAIDKVLGAEREVIGIKKHSTNFNNAINNRTGYLQDEANRNNKKCFGYGEESLTIPSTNEAKQWDGWGTALKPAMELWTLARKPIEEPTIAKNVIKYGTGGINIDECRVETDDDIGARYDSSFQEGNSQFVSKTATKSGKRMNIKKPDNINLGRFPANFIHDGSEEVENLFPLKNEESPSRFFYVSKASLSERNYGLSFMERKNIHPTVKPIELMRYLIKMITPKNGIVLDLYAGSGSTLIAAKLDKFQYVGIEREKEYIDIINARIKAYVVEFDIFDFL